MKYYTYILQSERDESFYVGYSSDPDSRLSKHNTSNKGYTSTKKPWRLVFVQSYESKSEAIKREKQIKKWKDRMMIRHLINSETNELG